MPSLFDMVRSFVENNVNAIPREIANAWNGTTDAVGTPEEAGATVAAIRAAVLAGYNVATFTASTANWAVPTHTEIVAIIINAGQNGVHGGSGGLHGSYLAQQLDLTGISALDIKIGAAGTKSQVREANGSYTGTLIVEGATHGTQGGIATAFGFTLTSSIPGSGGQAGNPGTSGTASPLAAGGTGGSTASAGNSGNAGQPGGSVSVGAAVKCGGGGGGGGSNGASAFGEPRNGGAGGAGGFPGGGGGAPGSGSGAGSSNGSTGPGGAGVIWLFYRG